MKYCSCIIRNSVSGVKFYFACTSHLNVNTGRQGLSKLRAGEVEQKICLWVG